MGEPLPLLVAGAGIAGLAAALAIASKGHPVEVFERATHILEVGAGLQITPNSSRILARLGVLERLGDAAIRPEALVLIDAATGRQLARMPLGEWAERRWQAPYLVAHRAELQAALIATLRDRPGISLHMGQEVTAATGGKGSGVAVNLSGEGRKSVRNGAALIAADGVWSALRQQVRGIEPSGFSGFIAWRATLAASAPAADMFSPDLVTVHVHPDFHLVAYPLRGGAQINLVAVVRGGAIAESWESAGNIDQLAKILERTRLGTLISATSWMAWPIHEVDGRGAWVGAGGIALAGDAAHAMSPFSAQGAAMAIEDAHVLADCLPPPGSSTEEMLRGLARYEARRKPRIARVARRTALNRRAWHARGPAALARNLYLAARGGERLMQDLDWLYGAGPPT